MTNQTPDAKMVLLPCPFCGGGASVSGDYHDNKIVCCESCWNGTDQCDSIADAVALWNARVSPTPQTWHPINPTDPSTLPSEDDLGGIMDARNYREKGIDLILDGRKNAPRTQEHLSRVLEKKTLTQADLADLYIMCADFEEACVFLDRLAHPGPEMGQ